MSAWGTVYRGAIAVVVGLVSPALGTAAITGVCPDGSVFIVQTRSQVPCAGAKEVEPSKIPPMRPENLPRPYLWEVYREGADTSRNPYHLLDRAEELRGGRVNSTPAPRSSPPQTATHPGPAPRVPSAPPLGLSDGEVRDLFFLVELSQQHAPVTFVDLVAGRERMRVSFAHSEAFARRFRESGLVAPASQQRVLVFSAVAGEGGEFHPHFTLVQGHLAFQPDLRDAGQMGLLRGEAGRLEAEGVVLGYVVLPEGFALERPLDLYWNDRRIEAARFTP